MNPTTGSQIVESTFSWEIPRTNVCTSPEVFCCNGRRTTSGISCQVLGPTSAKSESKSIADLFSVCNADQQVVFRSILSAQGTDEAAAMGDLVVRRSGGDVTICDCCTWSLQGRDCLQVPCP